MVHGGARAEADPLLPVGAPETGIASRGRASSLTLAAVAMLCLTGALLYAAHANLAAEQDRAVHDRGRDAVTAANIPRNFVDDEVLSRSSEDVRGATEAYAAAPVAEAAAASQAGAAPGAEAQDESAPAPEVGPDGYCLPHHRRLLVTQDARLRHALDDAASKVCQAYTEAASAGAGTLGVVDAAPAPSAPAPAPAPAPARRSSTSPVYDALRRLNHLAAARDGTSDPAATAAVAAAAATIAQLEAGPIKAFPLRLSTTALQLSFSCKGNPYIVPGSRPTSPARRTPPTAP